METILSANELLTVDEVAEYLRVAPNTVYRWCRDGKLTGIKIGKEWRIARTNLDSFLAERTGVKESSSLETLLYQRLTSPEHILVMTNDPDEVYRLQAEFLEAGLKAEYPLFVAAWWQKPAEIRARLTVAGLPVAELETAGKLTIGDLREAYAAGGPRGAIKVWEQQAISQRGQVLWGTGSHRLSDWQGRSQDLIRFEAELHHAFQRLPVIALCPCVLDPVDQSGFEALLNLAAHHSGALFMPNGEPVLMKTTN
ncbi:MAG: excisionase [Anaerolineae bacterium]|nr:excisionase [Anaerolineae bacterium]